MKDWKGNDIKVGDTVAVIKVSTKFYEHSGALELLSPEVSRVTKHPTGDGLWEVQSKHLIVEGTEGSVVYGGLSHLPLAMIEMVAPQSWEILAIVGTSDNKDEYYKRLIKTK